jgi:hypothetical protein
MYLRDLYLNGSEDVTGESKKCLIWLFFRNGGTTGKYTGAANTSIAESSLYFAGNEDIVCLPKLSPESFNYSFQREKFTCSILPIGDDESSPLDLWLLENLESYRDILQKGQALIPSQCTPYVEEIARRLDIPVWSISNATQEMLNNKAFLYDLMFKYGVKLPEFTVCHDYMQLKNEFEKLTQQYQGVVVKSTENKNGKFVLPFTGRRELTASRNLTVFPLIIEPYYEVLESLNYQFFINNRRISFLGASVQLLSKRNKGLIHSGNISIPENYFNRVIWNKYYDACSDFLGKFTETNYSGVLGIDLIRTTDDEVIIVDVNPRINASTFLYSVRYSGGYPLFKVFFFVNAKFTNNVKEAVEEVLKELCDKDKGYVCSLAFSPVIIKEDQAVSLNIVGEANSIEGFYSMMDIIEHRYHIDLNLYKQVLDLKKCD